MMRILPPILFLLFVAATCERSVDIDTEVPNPRLVVDCNFTPQQEMHVEVSTTKSIESSAATVYIEDATVEIFEGDEFVEQLFVVNGLTVDEPYYVNSDFFPEVDVLYNIKVQAPGFDPVMAQSKIPRPIDINTVQISNLLSEQGTNSGEMDYSYTVTISFLDPEKEKNYYHLNFFQQIYEFEGTEDNPIITGSKSEAVTFSSLNNSNDVTAYFTGGVLIRDAERDGTIISFSFDLRTTIQSDSELLGKMFVELRSVSEEYYLYYKSLSDQQSDPGPPYSEPVTIYNNIENGAGVFAGYNMAMDSIIIQ